MKRMFTWMSVAFALYSSTPALASPRHDGPPNGNPGTVHGRSGPERESSRERAERERREREERERREREARERREREERERRERAERERRERAERERREREARERAERERRERERGGRTHEASPVYR